MALCKWFIIDFSICSVGKKNTEKNTNHINNVQQFIRTSLTRKTIDKYRESKTNRFFVKLKPPRKVPTGQTVKYKTRGIKDV